MTVASSGVGAGCPFKKRTYDEFFLLMRHVTMRTHLGLGKDTPLGRAHESRSGRSRKARLTATASGFTPVSTALIERRITAVFAALWNRCAPAITGSVGVRYQQRHHHKTD
jgi:hypothetical protein